MTPAFQLHGNNVDTEAAGGLGALAGLKVSQPRTVRASTPAGKASDALPTASQVQPNAGSLPENTPEQVCSGTYFHAEDFFPGQYSCSLL